MNFSEQNLCLARLHDVTSEDVPEMVNRVPEIRTDFRAAIGLVVRAIHAVPLILADQRMATTEVYLGRSTEGELLRRWSQHRTDKQHGHGVVLFRTYTAQIDILEHLAIEILTRLKNVGALCVRNIVPKPIGAIPDTGYALIYMTVGHVSPVRLKRPTLAQLEEIAEEVVEEINAHDYEYEVSYDEVLLGLKAVRRREHADMLSWLPRYTR